MQMWNPDQMIQQDQESHGDIETVDKFRKPLIQLECPGQVY